MASSLREEFLLVRLLLVKVNVGGGPGRVRLVTQIAHSSESLSQDLAADSSHGP